MPYKDPDKQKEASRLAMQRYRARKQAGDAEWREKEKERKAKWFQDNKEERAEHQRQYRARSKNKEQ